MKKLRFINCGLAGDIYYNPAIPTPSSALFLYGFPAFHGPNEVTRLLVQNGFATIHPHYFGTYDSSKLFSVESSIETCRVISKLSVIGSVSRSKDGKNFPISPITTCVAHSFGGFTALRSLEHLTSLSTLILLAPTAHYAIKAPDYGVREEGQGHLAYVRASHPYTYRLDEHSDWEYYFNGLDPLPPEPITHPSLRTVIISVGDKDPYFDLPVFVSRIEGLVRAYCGAHPDVKILVNNNGGHGIDEHLSHQQVRSAIESAIK